MIQPVFAPPDWWRALMPGEWARLGELWVGLATITPEAARQILQERFLRNRKINPNTLRLLEMDIATGSFLLNGETIVFDLNGMIANGHHRLTAIGNGAVPVRLLVVIGADPARAFTTFDQHCKRTLGQILQMMKCANANTLAGALSYANCFLKTGIMNITTGALIVSRDTMLDLHSDRPAIAHSVGWTVEKLGTKTPFKHPSLVAALHFAFSAAVRGPNRQDIADDFFERMIRLRFTDEPKWSAPELLIRRLNEGKGEPVEGEEKKRSKRIVRATIPPLYIAALAIKAWNAYRRGTKMQTLRWQQGESFPRIDGIEYDGDGKPKI